MAMRGRGLMLSNSCLLVRSFGLKGFDVTELIFCLIVVYWTFGVGKSVMSRRRFFGFLHGRFVA